MSAQAAVIGELGPFETGIEVTGLNASGIFRKNVTKTEDWGENKQKLEVMPVYFPGLRSNGDPSLCIDVDGDKTISASDLAAVLADPDRGKAVQAAVDADDDGKADR